VITAQSHPNVRDPVCIRPSSLTVHAVLPDKSSGLIEETGDLFLNLNHSSACSESIVHDFSLLMVLYTTVDGELHRSPLDRTVLKHQAVAMDLIAAAGLHERDPNALPVHE